MSDEDQDMTLSIGIVQLPIIVTNFSDSQGGNPLLEAVLALSSEVLMETSAKLHATVAEMCRRQGVKYKMMDVGTCAKAAVEALQRNDPNQEVQHFVGVMSEKGEAILDDDYLKAKQSGKSVKN